MLLRAKCFCDRVKYFYYCLAATECRGVSKRWLLGPGSNKVSSPNSASNNFFLPFHLLAFVVSILNIQPPIFIATWSSPPLKASGAPFPLFVYLIFSVSTVSFHSPTAAHLRFLFSLGFARVCFNPYVHFCSLLFHFSPKKSPKRMLHTLDNLGFV